MNARVFMLASCMNARVFMLASCMNAQLSYLSPMVHDAQPV